jgi:FMN-dependent NADH-azoreductase
MKLLHIDSSVLGANSASRQLTAAVVEKEKTLHPGLEITYHDLAAEPPMHLSPAHVGAWFGHAPTDPAVIADIAKTDHYIPEIMAADIIVIGAPMYNFGIPTQLKAWIDRIVINGKTFKYTETGAPVGLVPAGKKVFLVSARGGMYTPGNPAAPYEHQESHVMAALGFIGLTDVTIIRAEGLAMPGQKEPVLEAALAQIAALTA